MAKRNRKARQVQASQAQPVQSSPYVRVVSQYDAAGYGRRMRGWTAPSSGPNRANSGLETIRNRSRDAARNEWTESSAKRVLATSLIGTGIVARPTTKDRALKALYTKIWDEFCKHADADGALDFYGLQTLAVKTWRSGGEAFIRLRWRRDDDGLPVPLQIQLLESDMVPVTLDADAWPGMQFGNTIRHGVERNRIGQKVAWWVYREHPGDGATRAVAPVDVVRVPYSEMFQLYDVDRPGQLRGVPSSSSVLAKMRSVGNFDDAVLVRQELANLFTVFITRPPGNTQAKVDPTTGLPIETDASGLPMIGLEPGISQELAEGEDVKFSDPPDAGANYSDYMRQQHLGIAAGGGVPYELMTGDLRDVSDRALRVVLTEFRRWCEQMQWQNLIPQMLQPVREACARAAVMAGRLTPAQAKDFAACKWAPHAWAYIHPVQDVQSRKLEVDAGFRSRSDVISGNGDDPEQVDADRAEDAKRERGIQRANGLDVEDDGDA